MLIFRLYPEGIVCCLHIPHGKELNEQLIPNDFKLFITELLKMLLNCVVASNIDSLKIDFKKLIK